MRYDQKQERRRLWVAGKKGERRMNENSNKLVDVITGLAAMGSSVAVVVSLIAAIVAFLSGEFTIARLCLAGTALAFGLLASAVFLGPRL
jgi:phosphomevalonate kinase